jgi:Heat induced stress protein YflT domain
MQLFTTPTADFRDFNEDGDEIVARYQTYAGVRAAIDRLADTSFPVQFTEIVGRDLRSVERATGRTTDARAAAARGAWFGLFIGLLLGLLTPGPGWLALLLAGLLIGLIWGAVLGFLAHRMGTGLPGRQPLRGDGRQRLRKPGQAAPLAPRLDRPLAFTVHHHRQETTMIPSIDCLAAQAHTEDLRREAEHSRAVEKRVRQMLRRTPPRQTTRKRRMIPAAGHR